MVQVFPAAHGLSSVLTGLRNIALAVLPFAGLLAAGFAQSAAAEPQGTNAECSKSTLTSDEFLHKLRTIALHGDLRDVPFIEQTLGVRMPGFAAYENGAINYKRKHYSAQLPGIDLLIDVNIFDDKPIKTRHMMAALDVNGDYFRNCSPFSAAQIEKAFGGTFTTKTVGSASFGGAFHDSSVTGVETGGLSIHVVYYERLSAEARGGPLATPVLQQYRVDTPNPVTPIAHTQIMTSETRQHRISMLQPALGPTVTGAATLKEPGAHATEKQSTPPEVFYTFGYEAFPENDAEILSYQYGEPSPSVPQEFSADAATASGGHIVQAVAIKQLMPVEDVLHVKWRVSSTGHTLEDIVDLRKLLPPNLDHQRIYFTVKGPKLYLYLIGKGVHLHPPGVADCPIQTFRYFNCQELYPGHWRNF